MRRMEEKKKKKYGKAGKDKIFCYIIYTEWSDMKKAIPLQAWSGPEGSRN
jgi:hypothetical protein